MSILPSESAVVNAPSWKYDGIGGWLIFVLIGLIVSPLIQVKFLITDLVPIFTDGAWSVLTTPGSEAYHPLWGPLILFEAVVNLAFIAAELILLVLLFRKHPVFPSAMIVWLLCTVLYLAADHLVAQQIPAVVAQKDPASLPAIVRSALQCVIWISYFRVSNRVKATFRVRG